MGPAATPPAISARDEELARIDAFLDRPEGPMALVLVGVAGIGKSTLWLAGIAGARSRGHLVLSSRPTQAEQGLSHVVVGDLFGDVASRVLPALAPPRRRALEQALLIGDAPDDPIDPRTLGVAIHSALELLARDSPLLLAIDDVQWVDSSSVEAVGFALRRETGADVRLLLARRSPDEAPSKRLEDALDPPAIERLTVEPLGARETAFLLRQHLGATLPRPTVQRLHEVSGGNPFYALEMARGLDVPGGNRGPSVEQPLPASIEQALAGRFAGFDPRTRSALLLIAVHGRMSSAVLRAAGVEPGALDAAMRNGVVERAGDEVRFVHSLLAAAVDQAATRDERRAAHERLASIVTDPIDRGRHLARATESPDAAVAAALEDAMTLARARGWSIAAAELADHALRVTPPLALDDRVRRAIATAHAHEAAGDPARAAMIADELLRDAPDGLPRARALVLRAKFGDLAQSQMDLREALKGASDDPALRSQIHAFLSEGDRIRDTRLAEQHARAAVAIADALGDESLKVGALIALSGVRLERGMDDSLALARGAYALARGTDDTSRIQDATHCLANELYWTGAIDEARVLLDQELEAWVERDEGYASVILFYLALAELSAGRWDLAAGYDARGQDISELYVSDSPWDFLAPALIAVHRGDLERASEAAERGVALGDLQGVPTPSFLGILGMVDAWAGRPGEAILRFQVAERAAEQAGRSEPGKIWWRADHVEALLQVARIEEATALLDAWEATAARLGRVRSLAAAVRCRGLVAAAKGDLGQAAILLERAVTDHEAAGDPFGRARAQLALGVARRRARQQGAARTALEDALAGFETLGAAGWVAAARDELGRVGGRRHVEGLSAAEQRVAALVADGHTNQEVAAQLFLGERTVASHLTHVYAKLGVRSRTELAAMWRMADRG